MDNFEQFIVKSRYCKWLPEQNRREEWSETVSRFMNYILNRFDLNSNQEDLKNIWSSIENREIFPSMRALMTAGPAADVDDVCLYNCSYVAVNEIRSFSDIMYILCGGTGGGFSCESENTDLLPSIPE